jgi:cytochrome c553
LAALFFGGTSSVPAEDRAPSALALELVKHGRLEDSIVACSACHRTGGEGDAGSGFGNLTALSKDYLAKQLGDFKSGARENKVMQVVAQNLTPADIETLSLYYSNLAPQAITSPIPEAPSTGIALAETGDSSRGILPCQGCHGSGPRSADKTIPKLYGQHPVYIVNQLVAWQSGLRKNDAGSVMAEIAKKLSEPEIKAVAIYFGRLPRSAP